MNLVPTVFSLPTAVLLSIFATEMLSPMVSARAATNTLVSGERGQEGRMLIQSDEFGTFGNCGPSQVMFDAGSGTRSGSWQCFGALMLTHGDEHQWLFHETRWIRVPVSALSDRNVVSDSVNETRTMRTSKFFVDLVDLEVDLVQQTPTSGYNFVQTYTFTNTGTQPLSLGAVLFNDQDLEFEQTPFDNRVGFVSGNVPRMYFIEESELAGLGDPGIDDRHRRISVAARMNEGITFDGYLGVKPRGRQEVGGALHDYLSRGNSPGILENDLNTIQDISTRGNLIGVNLDTDNDGLIDSPGDVAAAMQFSMDIPVGSSASLAVDYIGGSLSNAFIDLVGAAQPLQAGDADQDSDFDQFDLVQVQVAAEYLSGQTATWGEGDWDGAPGGSPGKPPVGDGLFNQLDIVAALGPAHYLTGPYASLHPNGQQGDGQTSILYNALTGELAVGAPAGMDLTSINIDSAAGVLTGDSARNLGGSFDNDGDTNIFKATFGSSFGSLSFGNVAQAGLPEDFVLGDLTVIGSLSGGGDLGNVDLIYVPEPASVLLLSVGLAIGLVHFRRVNR